MHFVPASDQALLVVVGEGVSEENHARVVKLLHVLQSAPVPSVCNLHPAYNSILIRFDPCATDHAAIEAAVRARATNLDALPFGEPRLVTIPVCYGGDYGPDLASVAAHHGLPESEVIAQHSTTDYHVYCLGFVPGFAYLGTLPQSIATPRLKSPRKRVAAGSVGIANAQTGVYPVSTPGGWRLIGRTPVRMFQADRTPMSLLETGDKVRFRPITPQEFKALDEASTE